MTAEAIYTAEAALPSQLTRSIGAKALQEVKPSQTEPSIAVEADLDTVKLFNPPEDRNDQLSVRTRALTATLVKEMFQKIPAGISADERDAERAKRRVDSVRIIFKSTGILPNDDALDEVFAALYRKKEKSAGEVGYDVLDGWFEKFEQNPAIKTLNTISATANMQDDLVYMRRTTLALLAEHSL